MWVMAIPVVEFSRKGYKNANSADVLLRLVERSLYVCTYTVLMYLQAALMTGPDSKRIPLIL